MKVRYIMKKTMKNEASHVNMAKKSQMVNVLDVTNNREW